MIRNVKDVTALLDQKFGSAGGKTLSLLRITAWFVIGLIVAGSLVVAPKVDINQTHYNGLIKDKAVRDPLLDMNDPRGYMHQRTGKHAFRIAWVGTSTMQDVGPHPNYVPASVLEHIGRINGKPIHIEMYLLEAGRMMDIYSAVHEAIATKPDLIMVDLNPLWLFNDRQLQQWDNLNGPDFAEMVPAPTNWRLMFGLDTPSQVALGTAGSKVAILRDRWSYAKTLQEWMHDISPLKVPNAAETSGNADPAGGSDGNADTANAKKPTGLGLVATMQSPLDFWNYYRQLVPPTAPVRQEQEALFETEQTNGTALSDAIVSKTLNALGTSNIPAAVYLPAVDPGTFKTPGVEATLHRVEKRLGKLAAANRFDNLTVRNRSAIRYLHGLQFKDFAHMTFDPPMVKYLARLLCSRVHASDPDSQCVPKG